MDSAPERGERCVSTAGGIRDRRLQGGRRHIRCVDFGCYGDNGPIYAACTLNGFTPGAWVSIRPPKTPIKKLLLRGVPVRNAPGC
jgi:hypothetical protein